MHFEEGYTYHIYNRGINHQKVFFSDENYIYFLELLFYFYYFIFDDCPSILLTNT